MVEAGLPDRPAPQALPAWWPGIDLEFGGQRQELAVQRVVQLGRHLALVARPGRAARRRRRTGVAGDDEPGLVATAHVAHQQTDAVWRVARRVQHIDHDIAGLEALAVGQRLNAKRHEPVLLSCRQYGAPTRRASSRPAGVVVGMHMGVDDVGDLDAGLLGLGDEPVLVAGDDIDGHGLAEAGAAEEIGQGRVLGGCCRKNMAVSCSEHQDLVGPVRSIGSSSSRLLRWAPWTRSSAVMPRASMQVPHTPTDARAGCTTEPSMTSRL